MTGKDGSYVDAYGRTVGPSSQNTFDHSQAGGQRGQGLPAGATTPYGPNTGGYQSEFVSYYNPHGGGTFIGVRADGSKEIISQAQAMDMGYVPPRRQVGDFYDLDNTQTAPGGPPNYVPGDQPWTPPDNGGGNNGGDPWTLPDNSGGSGTAPGTGTQPPPEGDGSTVLWRGQGSRPNWNWDFFQPKSPGAGEWGGYDQDYGVFSRYQPGQESPWGMPDIEGGNKEFYQQQFNNLLRDEQGFRNQQRAAALRGVVSENQRQADFDNGVGPGNDPEFFDKMWEDMDITPNKAVFGDPDAPLVYTPREGITKGMNNVDFFNIASQYAGFTPEELDDWQRFFKEGDSTREGSGWSRFDSPEEAIRETIPQAMSPEWSDRVSQLLRSAYTRNDLTTPKGGGPTAAPGYALPVGVQLTPSDSESTGGGAGSTGGGAAGGTVSPMPQQAAYSSTGDYSWSPAETDGSGQANRWLDVAGQRQHLYMPTANKHSKQYNIDPFVNDARGNTFFLDQNPVTQRGDYKYGSPNGQSVYFNPADAPTSLIQGGSPHVQSRS